ncbi:MAG: hypothetical protein JWP76_5281, partial [Dactylosporangium sp.]|nr:hypothetical protein [Dactylosporangium sp.]
MDSLQGVESQHAEVEQLVVQHAQRQPVIGVVGAVEGEPANVRGFDADRGAPELPVVATEGALAVPCLQDGGPPGRVAAPRSVGAGFGYGVTGAQDVVGVQPDRREDVGNDRGREVAV